MRTQMSMIVALLATALGGATNAGPAVAAPPGAATAARGPVLDPSFGLDGLVTSDHGAGDEVVDMVLQPDGKIVAVGGGYNSATPGGGFTMVRHLPDGRLDESFGAAGVVSTDVGGQGNSNHPYAVALRPDGRILVAGVTSQPTGWAPAVVSYLSDGTLDASFGPGGRRLLLGADARGRVSDMVLLPDGRALLAINAFAVDGEDPVVLARLRPDGELDPSFGDGGLVRADLSPREGESINTVALAPDGGIVVAGYTSFWGSHPEPTTEVLLARFDPNGTLDRRFGVGGRVIRDLTGPEGSDFVNGMTVAPDGRIVLTVSLLDFPVGEPTRGRAGLLRYLPDGRPDPAFGRRGYAPTHLPARIWDLGSPTVLPNGRIVTVGGTRDDTGDGDLALARFRPDGRPDPTFGRRGVVLTDVEDAAAFGSVLRVRPDGRLVVGGNTRSDDGGTTFAVFRFLP